MVHNIYGYGYTPSDKDIFMGFVIVFIVGVTDYTYNTYKTVFKSVGTVILCRIINCT